MEVLRERARAGSRPAERSDPHRVALVIEGGGMRGVVSVAMCATLQRTGLLPAFDLVAGTSAGALNGAALLAEVADASADEYAEGFANRKFMNPARLLLGRPIIDVGYVLDYASARLDGDRHVRTLESPIELHCVATDVEQAAARRFTDLRTYDELRTALLATSRLPWIGGDPVEFQGRRLIDGGISEPVALPTALDAGATHVLVMLTRPKGTFEGLSGGLGVKLVERHLRRLNPALVPLLRRRPQVYMETVERVAQRSAQPGGGEPEILGLWPDADAPQPSRLERDGDVIRGAAAAARATADALLRPLVAPS